MVQQALACGIHGLHFCHARNPRRSRRSSARRATKSTAGRRAGLKEGIRMFGTHQFAAWVWGVAPKDYYDRADPWPLNPRASSSSARRSRTMSRWSGRRKRPRARHRVCRVGPADTSYSNGFFDVAMDYGRKPGVVEPPPLRAAAERVIKACKAANVFILDKRPPRGRHPPDRRGHHDLRGRHRGGRGIGRRHTKRTLPWKPPADARRLQEMNRRLALLALLLPASRSRPETVAFFPFDEPVGLYPSSVLSDHSAAQLMLVLGPGGSIVPGKFGNAFSTAPQPPVNYPPAPSSSASRRFRSHRAGRSQR